jgi:hypothetical protein
MVAARIGAPYVPSAASSMVEIVEKSMLRCLSTLAIKKLRLAKAV